MKWNFCFAIKTFNRPESLMALVKSIKQFYNNPIYVIDDGKLEVPKDFIKNNNIIYKKTKFDIGVSAGRNLLLDMIKEEYFILMDDDWIVKDDSNFHLMLKKIKQYNLDILGGQFIDKDNISNKYYGNIYTDNNILYLKKEFAEINDEDCNIKLLDVTSNFFMAKTDSARKIKWDKQYIIGGEHIDFFYRAKNILKVGQINNCFAYNNRDIIFIDNNYKNLYQNYRDRSKFYLDLFLKTNNFVDFKRWFLEEK